METLLKICAVCVICGVFCAMFRRYSPGITILVSLLCGAAAAAAALHMFSPVLDFLKRLQKLTGMESAVFSPLLKTVAIGILAEISGAFCQDAGEAALGKIVALCGTILSTVCLLPLALLALDLLQTMIGG